MRGMHSTILVDILFIIGKTLLTVIKGHGSSNINQGRIILKVIWR